MKDDIILKLRQKVTSGEKLVTSTAAQWNDDDDGEPAPGPYLPTGFDKFDAIVMASGAAFAYGGSSAANQINPKALISDDVPIMADNRLHVIVMPDPSKFTSPLYYASAVAHELIHWSELRNRPWKENHGVSREDHFLASLLGTSSLPEQYMLGEVVAEVGSALLLDYAGLNPPVDDSASYAQGWLAQYAKKAGTDIDDAFAKASALAANAVNRLVGAAP